MKANPRKRILQILNETGIDGFDCASINEVCLASEINPKKEIFFNNPIKRSRDIADAKKLGIRYFTAQTRGEIDKILKASYMSNSEDQNEIAIRMETQNPNAQINLSEKFGASEKETAGLINYIKQAAAKFAHTGISMHTGSQNTDLVSYGIAIRTMSDIAKNSGGVQSINIGGGIPVQPDTDSEQEILKYLDAINRAVRDNIKGALIGNKPKIIAELGRSVVADCVDLYVPVLSSETRSGKKCVYIDDGVFTSFSDSVIHGWEYPLNPVRPFFRRKAFRENVQTKVFGRTCDSGDYLTGDYLLPSDLDDGDYIHVPCAGAYMDSQASRFNGFETPKYISYNI